MKIQRNRQNIHIFMSQIHYKSITFKNYKIIQLYQNLNPVLYLHIKCETHFCFFTFKSNLGTLKWQCFEFTYFHNNNNIREKNPVLKFVVSTNI